MGEFQTFKNLKKKSSHKLLISEHPVTQTADIRTSSNRLLISEHPVTWTDIRTSSNMNCWYQNIQ